MHATEKGARSLIVTSGDGSILFEFGKTKSITFRCHRHSKEKDINQKELSIPVNTMMAKPARTK
jgi:hypothetical protein